MPDIFLISIGLVIAVIGIVGCIIPAVPGPPLNFISLLILEAVTGGTYSPFFYVLWGAITILSIILDYVFPVWSAKKFNASRYGIWGSIIGMLIGIIFFPPFGMIAGLLLGAIAGELFAGKESSHAMKVGMVTFISSLLMILFKLAASLLMTYYFSKAALIYLF